MERLVGMVPFCEHDIVQQQYQLRKKQGRLPETVPR